ncbi:MAG TPA: tetratricopeptide repeat protein, partial [Candidatus Gracilibacteria bacterium]|nr:tetratricopeptide repeat protein [Candidatus Gracilibacteria bacterium]
DLSKKISNKEVLQLLQKSEQAKFSNDYPLALKYAEQALAKDPTCSEAAEEIADNYLYLEEIEKAENAADFAVSLDPKSYTALYILGFIASRKNKFTQSIDYLEMANDLSPNHPEILRSLGWSYFMAKKELKGTVILERALNLSPDDSMILCDLGFCYLKQNQLDKSLDILYRALEINPNDERVRECIQLAESLKGTNSPKKTPLSPKRRLV